MSPKVEWAIDLEVMRARGIIVSANPTSWLKNIETKHLALVKANFNPFLPKKQHKYGRRYKKYRLVVVQPIGTQH